MKEFFTKLGFTVSAADEAVFYKIDGSNFTIVATATDDFTVIADSSDTANNLIQKKLTERFKISDLGPINWLLGVSITRDLTAHTIFFLGTTGLHRANPQPFWPNRCSNRRYTHGNRN